MSRIRPLQSHGKLDLSSIGLTNVVALYLPFESLWKSAKSIDLRGNAFLTRIPSSLGHLDAKTTTEIRFDENQSGWSALEKRIAKQDAASIIQYAEQKLRGTMTRRKEERNKIDGCWQFSSWENITRKKFTR